MTEIERRNFSFLFFKKRQLIILIPSFNVSRFSMDSYNLWIIISIRRNLYSPVFFFFLPLKVRGPHLVNMLNMVLFRFMGIECLCGQNTWRWWIHASRSLKLWIAWGRWTRLQKTTGRSIQLRSSLHCRVTFWNTLCPLMRKGRYAPYLALKPFLMWGVRYSAIGLHFLMLSPHNKIASPLSSHVTRRMKIAILKPGNGWLHLPGKTYSVSPSTHNFPISILVGLAIDCPL